MSHKRIGIVGGVGPSATVLYYQHIIQGAYELWKGTHLPEIVIYSLFLAISAFSFRLLALFPILSFQIPFRVCLRPQRNENFLWCDL